MAAAKPRAGRGAARGFEAWRADCTGGRSSAALIGAGQRWWRTQRARGFRADGLLSDPARRAKTDARNHVPDLDMSSVRSNPLRTPGLDGASEQLPHDDIYCGSACSARRSGSAHRSGRQHPPATERRPRLASSRMPLRLERPALRHATTIAPCLRSNDAPIRRGTRSIRALLCRGADDRIAARRSARQDVHSMPCADQTRAEPVAAIDAERRPTRSTPCRRIAPHLSTALYFRRRRRGSRRSPHATL